MSDRSRQATYLSLLSSMDKKGNVSFNRSDEGDIELSDVLLRVESSEQMGLHRTDALQAIETFYTNRQITIGGLARFYTEFEKTEEGRAALMLDATMTALTCETVAAVSVAVGVYELAAAFFVAGAYKACEAFQIAGKR